MTFKELFQRFLMGTPIKRKLWGGYWKCDRYSNTITIHTKEGQVISLTDTKDVIGTIAHMVADDWEIATNDNCEIEVK